MNFDKLKIEAAINIWEHFYQYRYPITYKAIFDSIQSLHFPLYDLEEVYTNDIDAYQHGNKEDVLNKLKDLQEACKKYHDKDYPFRERQFTDGWLEEQPDGSRVKMRIEKDEFPILIDDYVKCKITDIYFTSLFIEYYRTVLNNPDFELNDNVSEVDNWIFVPDREPGEGKDERSQFIKNQYWEVFKHMEEAHLMKPRFVSTLAIELIDQVYALSPTFDDIDVLANYREPIDPVSKADFELFFHEVLNTSEKLSNIEIRRVFNEALYGIAHKKAADYKNVSIIPSLQWLETKWDEIVNPLRVTISNTKRYTNNEVALAYIFDLYAIGEPIPINKREGGYAKNVLEAIGVDKGRNGNSFYNAVKDVLLFDLNSPSSLNNISLNWYEVVRELSNNWTQTMAYLEKIHPSTDTKSIMG